MLLLRAGRPGSSSLSFACALPGRPLGGGARSPSSVIRPHHHLSVLETECSTGSTSTSQSESPINCKSPGQRTRKCVQSALDSESSNLKSRLQLELHVCSLWSPNGRVGTVARYRPAMSEH